jgi:hypothetical protein
VKRVEVVLLDRDGGSTRMLDEMDLGLDCSEQLRRPSLQLMVVMFKLASSVYLVLRADWKSDWQFQEPFRMQGSCMSYSIMLE